MHGTPSDVRPQVERGRNFGLGSQNIGKIRVNLAQPAEERRCARPATLRCYSAKAAAICSQDQPEAEQQAEQNLQVHRLYTPIHR